LLGDIKDRARTSGEISLSVEGIPVWFLSKLDDSKSTSRRITRRCPRRGEEEEALPIDKDIVKPRA
jgi:hypothetical protein